GGLFAALCVLAPEGQRRQRRRQQEDAVKTPALALLPLAIGLAASPAAGARKGPVKIDPIRSAMSAAPASVAAHATIARANADGTMTTLRKGTNGFTCMP